MISSNRSSATPSLKQFYAKNRREWRNWLAKNHDKQENIWLILYKKDCRTASVNYTEAVEEALCFGWIDSKRIKRDSESSLQFFARRNPKSKWSKLNKQRVANLSKLGLLAKQGLAIIQLAKKTGTWTALDEVEELRVPDDLSKALARNRKALKNFQAFPPSSRKIILHWILEAKQTATRKKRISETVKLAAKNIRANHYQP